MSVLVLLYRAPDMAAPEKHFVEGDVTAFLRRELGRRHFPAGGRIVDMSTGAIVTPAVRGDEQRLNTLTGPLVVEVFPRTGFEIGPLLAAIAASAVSMILTAILAPAPPNATQRNVQQESPNNGLSERTNEARINGRIPDIYGTVRSTLDLLAPPYKVFLNHVEQEIAYMCVGRGSYEIHDVRDDTTAISQIAGSSVQVYGPYTSPNSGAPQLTIGDPINIPVLTAKRVGSVNGQTLLPQDAGRVVRALTRFESPNVVRYLGSSADYADLFVPGDTVVISEAAQTEGTYTFSLGPDEAEFKADSGLEPEWGEVIFAGNHAASWASSMVMTITNGAIHWVENTGGDASTNYNAYGNVNGVYPVSYSTYDSVEGKTTVRLDISSNRGAWQAFRNRVSPVLGGPTMSRPSGVVQFDLSGTYVVNTVTSTTLTLNNPVAVNPDWDVMLNDYGGQSNTLRPVIATAGQRWVGWFSVKSIDPVDEIIANIVALNGLYADNGEAQSKRNVSYRLEAQREDANGDPVGEVEVYTRTIQGSATTRATRADTLRVALGGDPGTRWRFRCRRTTPTDDDFEGSVVDEIKWRDLYVASHVDQLHFGDVTTAQAVTFATDGALAIKERKLNMLVTRKLARRESDGSFSTELYASNDVADIISAICLDPKIGNRTPAEVDFDNIYQTAQAVRDYFGVDVAQFNYTIDADNLSFEETLSMIAEAVYCKAYRRGSVIRLFFERETEDSSLLFNHRNKVPSSEQRTDQFGNAEGNDGVEYQWIDPDNDAPVTIYLPEDRSAVNPKRIESVGVRIYEQAHLHAWRAWNKIQFQDEVAEFIALPEANMLTVSERFLCADNTRGESQDGDVLAVDPDEPRLITLSQPIDWQGDVARRIFLQNSDGRVEAMDVAYGGSQRHGLLERVPRTPIVARGEAYNTTTYIIGVGESPRQARAFLVTEKGSPNDDGTIPMTAINYDARYYQNDLDFHA